MFFEQPFYRHGWHGFGMQLLDHHFDPLTGCHVTAFSNQGPLLALAAALLQPKTGRGVNPVPAVEFFAALTLGMGLSPVIAFADVPSVDLDDPSEGFGRLAQADPAPAGLGLQSLTGSGRLCRARSPCRCASPAEVLRLISSPVSRAQTGSACSQGILETKSALISCTRGEAVELSNNPSTHDHALNLLRNPGNKNKTKTLASHSSMNSGQNPRLSSKTRGSSAQVR